MDFEEINLKDVLQTLQDAVEIKHIYEKTIDSLKEENQFLSDTLTQNKLGKITEERRNIKSRLYQLEENSKQAIQESAAIKSEYEQKLDRIAILIKDINSKQADINAYIDSEAESKIANKMSELENKYKKKVQRIKEEYNNKESLINIKILKYKKYMFISYIITMISIFIMIINFII